MKLKFSIIAAVFVFLSVNVALAEEVKLESVYGEGLYNVPTGVRLSFQNSTGKAWHDVSSDERRAFLANWLESNKKVIRDDFAYKKSLEERKKEQDARAKDLANRKRARAKAAADALLAKQKEKRQREKALADMKARREKTLAKLKRIQQMRNQKHKR